MFERQKLTPNQIKGLLLKAQKKTPMKIPIRYFEKLSVLTDVQDNYLLEYRSRVKGTDKGAKKFIERIDKILRRNPPKER